MPTNMVLRIPTPGRARSPFRARNVRQRVAALRQSGNASPQQIASLRHRVAAAKNSGGMSAFYADSYGALGSYYSAATYVLPDGTFVPRNSSGGLGNYFYTADGSSLDPLPPAPAPPPSFLQTQTTILGVTQSNQMWLLEAAAGAALWWWMGKKKR
jgi:hypothetical protein